MLIKIGEFECTECWDGVFYKKLANYPVITEWEIQTVLDFEHYEKQNGRDCFIEADYNILKAIDNVKNSLNVKGKLLYMPLRIKASGHMHGPELDACIFLLGKEKTLNNLRK